VLILLTLASLLSVGGAFAEESIAQPVTEHSVPYEGSIHDNLPCLPGATCRFSNRVNRTIPVPGSRIRPWTPVELDSRNSCIAVPPSPELFELPEGVQIYYTANTICTSPVRAGPEYIFS
jgi:hypothetical protein